MKRVLNPTPALLLAATLVCPLFAAAQSSGSSWSGGSPFGRLSAEQEKAALNATRQAGPVAVISSSSSFLFAGWTAVPNMGCLPAWDVTVDGSESSSPHGPIVNYEWTWMTGPGLPGGQASSPTPLQTLRMVGNRFLYTVKLTVTDRHKKSGSSAVNITTPLREEQPPGTC